MTDKEVLLKALDALQIFEAAGQWTRQSRDAVKSLEETLDDQKKWGMSQAMKPEYINEQKRKTEEVRSMLEQKEQSESIPFDVWLQECENMTTVVRHGVKFLLMPEESAVRIGTAIQDTRPWRGINEIEYKVVRDVFVKQGKTLRWLVDQIDKRLKEKNTNT
jgi:hypothetical protein